MRDEPERPLWRRLGSPKGPGLWAPSMAPTEKVLESRLQPSGYADRHGHCLPLNLPPIHLLELIVLHSLT